MTGCSERFQQLGNADLRQALERFSTLTRLFDFVDRRAAAAVQPDPDRDRQRLTSALTPFR